MLWGCFVIGPLPQGALLMKDSGKSSLGHLGLPATPDALQAYAERVLRPGQVQSFGVVMMVGMENSSSTAHTGAEPGTIMAVSDNCEEHLGLAPAELLDTNLFTESTSPFTAQSLHTLRAIFSAGDLAAHAPIILTLTRRPGVKIYVIAHATEEGVVLDLEPIDDATGHDMLLEVGPDG